MQPLIDYTVFKNKLLIANVADATDARTYLTGLIPPTQYEFLQKLLGPGMYEQFDEWYTDGQDPMSPFYSLLNGLTFTYHGKTCRWEGIKVPLANYVYYTYQELDVTQTVSGGEVKTKSQNAVNASSVQKMTDRWNEMVEYLCAFWPYMDLFFGTTGNVSDEVSFPAIKAPITVQADVTPGITSGTSSFTFDGTGGKPDWRGYIAYPERIGQGTMVSGVGYTWSPVTGGFILLQSGDIFQPNEYFNFTFSLPGATYFDLVANPSWADYRCEAAHQDIFHLKNRWGL